MSRKQKNTWNPLRPLKGELPVLFEIPSFLNDRGSVPPSGDGGGRITIAFLFLIFATFTSAQNPLNQKISLQIADKNVEEALDDIADAGGFNFSYNPDIVSVDRRVAINTSNEPVRDVLDDVLGQEMNYKVRGSYVIIQPPKKKQPKQTFEIKGEIKDASTGKKIEDVTIYEVDKLKSTLSGNDGSYDMTVSRKAEYVNVAIAKKNYRDTIIRVSKSEPLPTIIELQPLENQEVTSRVSIDSSEVVQFFVPARLSTNMDNVDLVERRRFQISFLPFAGTNRLMSGKITNNVSINLLAGYSRSVENIEIGGIANIVRENMTGIQIGGLANYVGGKTTGVQVGGLFNVTRGEVDGVQVGGLMNIGTDRMVGWQIGGLMNITKRTKATQLAGLINIAWQDAKQVQLSGIGNYAKNLKGAQLSAYANVTTNKMQGTQIAIANYAGEVRGVQIGLVNIADTVASGVNIGLINYVRKGLHKLEYSRNDVLRHNLAFKTGTYKFYNILQVGLQNDIDLGSVGYGFGTQKNFKGRTFTNLELTGNYLFESDEDIWDFDDINFLGKLNLNFGYRFAKHFSLSGGPVLHAYISDVFNPDTGSYGFDIDRKPFFDEEVSSSGLTAKMWIGWQVAAMF